MAKKLNTRAAAAKISWQIIDEGQSLDGALKSFLTQHDFNPQDRGLIQELVYGVCRWCGELEQVAEQLLKKPIRNKDRVIHYVLLVGLYQLRYLQTAEHAAVAETVSACQQLKRVWAKNLINGCLRTYQRELASTAQEFTETLVERISASHPKWLIIAIEKAWPDQSADILAANNERPPMCLRVNQAQQSRDQYLSELIDVDIACSADQHSPDGIVLLSPVGVDRLPRFESGAVSVQDTAAQIACGVSKIEAGEVVLDSCAAPGGKSAHLLEKHRNKLTLDALDINERRCEQLAGTMSRLQLDANIFVADARSTKNWPTPEQGYDSILIDAPCSGTGVIRRHPDIKHHRRPDDIDKLVEIQQSLLTSLWQVLKQGGRLLYMTCSILPEENAHQIKTFLANNADAQLEEFDHPNALELDFGKQTLQGVHSMDGFYYCLLVKSARE